MFAQNFRVYWLYNDSFLPNGDPISVITSENSATLIFKQTDSKFIEPGKYQCAAELQVSADPNSPIWRVMSDPVMLIPIGSHFLTEFC